MGRCNKKDSNIFEDLLSSSLVWSSRSPSRKAGDSARLHRSASGQGRGGGTKWIAMDPVGKTTATTDPPIKTADVVGKAMAVTIQP